MNNIFSNLNVIELASVLAGPAVGMFFAELGANVIKVENKNGGDLTRHWKQKGEDPNSKISAYYHSVNWNKKVIFLDLNNEDDRKQVFELIDDADILLLNFKPGDDSKFGLTKDILVAKFPTLIIGEIKGFEDSDRVAYDAVLQAETGFMSMNGTEQSGPLKMPVALIDILAAHQLKEGILIALLNRMQSKKGAYVKVDLFSAAVASLANQAANYLNNNIIPGQAGSLHPNIAPYGEILTTADGKQVILAVGTDQQFRNLCDSLHLEALKNDHRFNTNPQRLINRTSLYQLLTVVFEKFSADIIMNKFEKFNVPAGLIRNLEEVFQQPSAKRLILFQVEDDTSTSKRVSTLAFKMEFS